MSLEEYTDSNRTDHEIAKQRIHRILQEQARGKSNAISSASLADRVPVSASTVRDLVPEIRRELGVPIGSTTTGYFIVEDPEVFRRQVERQRRQAENSLQVAREISRAWYQSQEGGTQG